MKSFMNEDFLLQNESSKELFHNYCEQLPIIDYHCHLSAKDIYDNIPFKDLSELWLYDDHYKWRAIRSNGISEYRITCNNDPYDKFLAFAETLPYAIGNPLYHWSHLELKRYFGISSIINKESAPEIWKKVNDQLSDNHHTPQFFINSSNVYALCTTEAPTASLKYHHKIANENILSTKVLPAFRPDNILSINNTSWSSDISQLAELTNVNIDNWEDLLMALSKRMDDFSAAGCIASDHGFISFPYRRSDSNTLTSIIEKARCSTVLNTAEIESFQTELMIWLGTQYYIRGWAMEIHINALRNCNTTAVNIIGEAKGFDSVNDSPLANNLCRFMNDLEKGGQLPKTILFSLNDADNLVISTMLGNFQSEEMPSKIQMGSAWWFLDNIDGMEKQIKILANEGLLGRFIGMLTDSRSFLSYTRHEYFRRILCNIIGSWVDDGLFPNDQKTLKMLVEGISFYNAKAYFNL